MADEELPFSLDWLAGAANRPKETLSVCDLGHLVVNARSCWAVSRFSPDLHALYCRPVDHPDGE